MCFNFVYINDGVKSLMYKLCNPIFPVSPSCVRNLTMGCTSTLYFYNAAYGNYNLVSCTFIYERTSLAISFRLA